MDISESPENQNFTVVGVSFQKADIATRGSFSFSDEQYIEMLNSQKAYGKSPFFVLSTCNRTELYGFSVSPDQLMHELAHYSVGTIADLKENGFSKTGDEAVQYLFRVGVGLESQIP